MGELQVARAARPPPYSSGYLSAPATFAGHYQVRALGGVPALAVTDSGVRT